MKNLGKILILAISLVTTCAHAGYLQDISEWASQRMPSTQSVQESTRRTSVACGKLIKKVFGKRVFNGVNQAGTAVINRVYALLAYLRGTQAAEDQPVVSEMVVQPVDLASVVAEPAVTESIAPSTSPYQAYITFNHQDRSTSEVPTPPTGEYKAYTDYVRGASQEASRLPEASKPSYGAYLDWVR